MASDVAPATFCGGEGAVVGVAGSIKVPEAYAESIIGFDRRG
jgi:hypothetical protein